MSYFLVGLYRVYGWGDKEVLEMHSSDDYCTTLWMNLMPLNCWLKKWLQRYILCIFYPTHEMFKKVVLRLRYSNFFFGKVNETGNCVVAHGRETVSFSHVTQCTLADWII